MQSTTDQPKSVPAIPAPTPAGPPDLLSRVPGLADAGRWASAYLSPVRLEILMFLFTRGERAVNEIATALELDRSSISHALTLLRDDGLVSVRAIDRRRLYSLSRRVEIRLTRSEPNPTPRFALKITRKDGWALSLAREIGEPMGEVVVRAVKATPLPRDEQPRTGLSGHDKD